MGQRHRNSSETYQTEWRARMNSWLRNKNAKGETNRLILSFEESFRNIIEDQDIFTSNSSIEKLKTSLEKSSMLRKMAENWTNRKKERMLKMGKSLYPKMPHSSRVSYKSPQPKQNMIDFISTRLNLHTLIWYSAPLLRYCTMFNKINQNNCLNAVSKSIKIDRDTNRHSL